MRCKFCYATFHDYEKGFLPKGHLPKEASLRLIEMIAAHGAIRKITFAGGEPTLCPWLPELVAHAKSLGLTTMLISNGTRLTDEYLDLLKGSMDWIGLSIDSLFLERNIQSGRCAPRFIPDENNYKALVERIHTKGFRLKVNTVVTQINKAEIMAPFINWAVPERWKIMQVLPVEGQNDKSINELLVSEADFSHFVHSNALHTDIIRVVPESNDCITGSYLMIDPAGRFFDDTKGHHTYSNPILEVGLETALRQIRLDEEKFKNRGGEYNW